MEKQIWQMSGEELFRELECGAEGLTAREAAEDLAKATRSEVVQVIGTKFVLYRQSHRKDKKDKIVLLKK